MSCYYVNQREELYHHGIKGQKWGLRRFQYEDGSLTSEGRQRYGYGEARKRMTSAKENLENLRNKQITRDFLYGDLGRLTKKGRQLNKDLREAKKEYKESKKEYKIAKKETKRDEDVANVKEYQNKFAKMDKMGDKLDSLWEQGKSGTKAYEKLKVEYDKLGVEAKAAYKKTGRNIVERVANNIKYEKTPEKLSIQKSDSSVTKNVKKDYNNLTAGEFKRKYATDKDTYAKRVEKYGDPYMNSPLAQAGKKMSKNK